MDFDLFEQEDDDILSSVYISPTQKPDITINLIPEFNCIGEDSKNAQFAGESFVRNLFVLNKNSKYELAIDEIVLSAYEFKGKNLHSTLVNNFIFGEARMNIQILMASLKSPIETDESISYYQRRRQVTMLYHLILSKANDLQWNKFELELASLRKLLNRITNPDVLKLIYIANSFKGNETNTPAYHFLHGCLEWKLLDLFILKKFEEHSPIIDHDKSEFFQQLDRIFDDLLILSVYLFAKKKYPELMSSSPFPCTCCKELWLVIQLSLENWSKSGENIDSFWHRFNRSINKLKTKLDDSPLTSQSLPEFTNWMIKALMRLHGYRSNGTFEGAHHSRVIDNYVQLETTTQQFLNSNPSEEPSRVFICVLMPVVLEWWKPNVNMSMILWEHFHKRLNSSFYIAGTSPSNLAVTSLSGKGYLEKSQSLLANCQPDANLSSFTLFTIVLGKTLERLRDLQQVNQTQKLLGRIYSKFSLAKFLALAETGIHHLIELFLALALSGDFNEIAPKLKEKLLSISLDKITPSKQIAVAKGHVALLILFSYKKSDISEYVGKLLQQLANIRNDIGVSKILADGLLDVFRNSDNFSLGEHLLIDSWIPNYLNTCTPVEQERSLEALHLIFEKIRSNDHMDHISHLFKSLNAHILPFIKQNYMKSFSLWMPQLAADFCINQSSVGDVASFQRLFRFFIETNNVNRQAVSKFLLHILESDKSSLVDTSVIIQVWLKSLVLLSANNEDVVKLTGIVSNLDEFKFLSGIFNEDALKAKEPICVFIAAVGKSFDACTDFQKRCVISDKLNSYLASFEKWISTDVRNEKAEVTFRFYSFIAIVIYNCANIVYTKSKITCFFHIAMTRFILPTPVQMGKPPEGKLAQVVHKVWPVLVQGIGRLNFRSDPYITKTLTDLITKWTPHFKISPNSKIVARPFVTCLNGDNSSLSLFVFEKLTSMFLATQRRQADPNACLVITIFQSVIESIGEGSDDELKKLETFLKATCLTILEHIMMVDEIVPSRGLLVELFKKIVKCNVFQNSPEMRSLIAEHLRIITKRHLSYYTFFYFELLTRIVNIYCPLVEDIMEFLLEEIRIVEEKRGGGEDNRIRSCLQNLKKALTVMNNKK